MDSREVGFCYLGPILYRFCRDLDTAIRGFPLEDTTVLFVSRGGFRIRRLLNQEYPHAAYFRISRAAVARACYTQIPTTVKEVLRDCPNIHADLTNHVEEYVLLRRYLRETLGSRGVALMVDTGARGTSQFLLSKAFPEYGWYGLYFGLWNYVDPKVKPPWFPQCKGLYVNSEHRAIIPYWHLFEDTLEAGIPMATTFSDVAFDPQGIEPSPDTMFQGVCEYFKSKVAIGPEISYQGLAHRILYPSAQDLTSLVVPDRDGIPVIARNGNVMARWRNTLWPQGQLRREFGPLAFPFQAMLNLYGKVAGKW